ncbi:MAG: glycerol dehydratase reactivase beta/small subunit family protein [Moorellaceae bacterium]
MKTYEEIRPSIMIYVTDPEMCSPVLKGLAEGLEEEGVPFNVRVASGEAETLAIEAARASRLGVGIGVHTDGTCVLQHQRLRPGRPIARVTSATGSRENYRLIGSHAARLVKNLPLKEVDRGSTGFGAY